MYDSNLHSAWEKALISLILKGVSLLYFMTTKVQVHWKVKEAENMKKFWKGPDIPMVINIFYKLSYHSIRLLFSLCIRLHVKKSLIIVDIFLMKQVQFFSL